MTCLTKTPICTNDPSEKPVPPRSDPDKVEDDVVSSLEVHPAAGLWGCTLLLLFFALSLESLDTLTGS